MKRLLYRRLTDWKAQEKRKPLLLQGARQVGKTHLLKDFGRQEYSDVAHFNTDSRKLYYWTSSQASDRL